MSEVQTEAAVQVTPPPTFGDLEAKSKAAAAKEANPPAAEDETKPVDTTAEKKVVEDPTKTATQTDPAEKKAEEPVKAADGKETKEPGKEDKPAPPEKYELKLAENSPLDKAALDRVAAYAKAQGLSQEDAQGVVRAQEEDVNAFINDRKAIWKEQTISDKEIGGESLKENLVLANDMIERFASPALKAELTKTGYGNHPEMVRMLVKIGKASANDRAVIPNVVPKATKSVAQIMYDKTT